MIREGATGEVGIRREGSAYRSGWEDGRFGQVQTFANNNNLAAWTELPGQALLLSGSPRRPARQGDVGEQGPHGLSLSVQLSAFSFCR